MAGGGALLIVLALTEDHFAGLRPVLPAVFCLLAIALLGWFQQLALPTGWVALLSSFGHELAAATAALDPGLAREATLSLAPDATARVAMTFAAGAAWLVVAALLGRERFGRRALAVAVIATALFEVLYGAKLWAAGSAEIWGVSVPLIHPRLRGTFVNPDHLATLLLIALPVVLGLGSFLLGRLRYEPALERRLLLVVPVGLVWLTLFVGLAFTGSRAGLVAGMVGTAVPLVLAAAFARRKRFAVLALALPVAGVGLVLLVGANEGLGRLLGTTVFDDSLPLRLDVYAATAELWLHFPVFGCGLGAFADVFPRFQAVSTGGAWRHAHNDPLELLATGGLLAAMLFAFGFVQVVRRLVRVLQATPRSEDRAAALAGLGVVAGLMVQESFDFGLTLPANALWALVVIGAAAATPAPEAVPKPSGRHADVAVNSGRRR